jgi:hypothetical protein
MPKAVFARDPRVLSQTNAESARGGHPDRYADKTKKGPAECQARSTASEIDEKPIT